MSFEAFACVYECEGNEEIQFSDKIYVVWNNIIIFVCRVE